NDEERDCCPLGPTGGAPCDLPVGAALPYCGGHSRRLSALLAENVAREARRAGLSERSDDSTIIRPQRSDLVRPLVSPIGAAHMCHVPDIGPRTLRRPWRS